jgi:tRNA threonylcarbamoyladenosine biosynthesis protein TsaB
MGMPSHGADEWHLLALDTSTHLMSVGVSTPQAVHRLHDSEGGAQASTRLIPVVLDLLAQAETSLPQLDALVFGHGPGAFTGLRTAAAVVQGLAYGTRTTRHPNGLPVLGVSTLLAVAEEARFTLAAVAAQAAPPAAPPVPCTITAVLDARMDEVYAATYHFADVTQPVAVLQGGPWLVKPEHLAPLLSEAAQAGVLAGNALAVYGPRLPATAGGALAAWPTASALLRLAPALLAQGLATTPAEAQPVYVRNKVAQTTEERSPRSAHVQVAQTAPVPHTPSAA